MLISELIHRLQEAQRACGDLEVMLRLDNGVEPIAETQIMGGDLLLIMGASTRDT